VTLRRNVRYSVNKTNNPQSNMRSNIGNQCKLQSLIFCNARRTCCAKAFTEIFMRPVRIHLSRHFGEKIQNRCFCVFNLHSTGDSWELNATDPGICFATDSICLLHSELRKKLQCITVKWCVT